MCASLGIEHRTTISTILHKSWLAERSISSLRTAMSRIRASGAGQRPLSQVMKTIERFFNENKRNVSTKLTPNETSNEIAGWVLQRREEKRLAVEEKLRTEGKPEKLNVGDVVLKRLPPHVFKKQGDPNYSDLQYVIVSVRNTRPLESYKIRLLDESEPPLQGTFALSSLAKVQAEATPTTTLSLERKEPPSDATVEPPSRRRQSARLQSRRQLQSRHYY